MRDARHTVHSLRAHPFLALRVRTLARAHRSLVQEYAWTDRARFELFLAAVRLAGQASVEREIIRWSKMSYRRLTMSLQRLSDKEVAFFRLDDALLSFVWKVHGVDNAIALAVAGVINQNRYIELLVRRLKQTTNSPQVLQARKTLYVDITSFFDRHAKA